MFKTDQEFIGRYKKSIIPVPQKVEVPQVKQEVKQEVSSWAKKIALSGNISSENSSNTVSNSASNNVSNNVSNTVSNTASISAVKEVKGEVKEQSALELIKAALAQISSALLLLEGIKPYPDTSSQILHQVTDMTAKVAEVTANTSEISEITKALATVEEIEAVEAVDAVDAIAIQESHNDSVEIVSAEVELSDFIKKVKPAEDDEFRTITSKKKSKNKTSQLIIPILKKEDDFPSLGSSFSPIKKSGIWGEKGNKSLQIAKSIANVPSPSPVSSSPSPSPYLKKSGKLCRGGGAAAISSEDEYSDTEYSIQKCGNEDWE